MIAFIEGLLHVGVHLNCFIYTYMYTHTYMHHSIYYLYPTYDLLLSLFRETENEAQSLNN